MRRCSVFRPFAAPGAEWDGAGTDGTASGSFDSALDQAGFVVNRGKIPSTEQTYADARSGLSGLSTIPKESAQRGDLIFFNYIGPSRTVSHVGLVTAAGGGRISTVEGNTNEPSEVATHEFQINNKRIVGIVRVSGLRASRPDTGSTRRPTPSCAASSLVACAS